FDEYKSFPVPPRPPVIVIRLSLDPFERREGTQNVVLSNLEEEVKQYESFLYSVWLNQGKTADVDPLQIMTDHNLTLNDLFFLPILFIGFLILGVCFAFCCYLLRTTRDDYDIDVESPRRIRYDGLRRGNYRKKWLKKVSLKSDTCAICLDDFQHKEEISICRCGHAYHHK
ncbi:unnamed protein product, partial [Pocillopora meandrina]